MLAGYYFRTTPTARLRTNLPFALPQGVIESHRRLEVSSSARLHARLMIQVNRGTLFSNRSTGGGDSVLRKLIRAIVQRIRHASMEVSPQLIPVIPRDMDKVNGHVVFIHGLGGDSIKTWTSPLTRFFWPNALAQDCPYLAVWTVGYNAAPTMWVTPSMTLPEMATSVASLLTTKGITGRPLVFVTHSLGGLVAKQMLRKSAEAMNGSREAELSRNTLGVVFMGTPHAGARLADWIHAWFQVLGVSEQVRDLGETNTLLHDLNSWFRSSPRATEMTSLVFYEKDTVGPFKIVPDHNADPGLPGVTPIPIAGDHLEICKPVTKDAAQYKTVQHFVEERFCTDGQRLDKIRHREIEDVLRLAASDPAKKVCLWVTGVPGCGKTCFSMALAARISKSQSYVYVSQDQFQDTLKLSEAIMKAVPLEFMRARAAREHDGKPLTDVELRASAIDAIVSSDQPVVVEGTQTATLIASPLLQDLVSRITPAATMRVIITGYTPPPTISVHEVHYPLPPLSLPDAIAIMRHSRPSLSIEDAVNVHRRYDGHALSISAWAVSGDPVNVGIPAKTEATFRRHWDAVTPQARELFCALCDEPDLGVPSIMPYEERECLTREGLLSQYPCARPDGVSHYVHQVAKSACYELLPGETHCKARIALLERALDCAQPNVGPRLLGDYIANADMPKAVNLLLLNGREWVESTGLRGTRGFLSAATIRLTEQKEAFFFAKYLSALTTLFSGEYEKAEMEFASLAEEAAGLPAAFRLGISFERLECRRREGHAVDDIAVFNEIYTDLHMLDGSRWTHLDRYFAGVAHFLAGSFLRHFNAMAEAHREYEMAASAFGSDQCASNTIETVHCLYARTQCQQQVSVGAVAGCEELVRGTKSMFLLGLFRLAQARAKAVEGEYLEAEALIGEAKSSFLEFGSSHYYRKAGTLLTLIALARGDLERARLACGETLQVGHARGNAELLQEVLSRMADHPRRNRSWLLGKFSDALNNGKSAGALSLLCIYEHLGHRLGDETRAFRTRRIERQGEHKWQLVTIEYPSLALAQNALMAFHGVPDARAGIMLFE